MKLHGNAALSLNGRRRMVALVVEQDRSIREAAEAAGVSDRTCLKWVARYRGEGDAGLVDRSSAPGRVHNRTDERLVQLLVALRRLRFSAPELADLLGMPVSTISGVLKRIGMGKLGRLGLEPALRYERERPGELIHIDVKKLGRIQGGAGKRITGRQGINKRLALTDAAGVRRGTKGWDAVHIAIDDATRLAYVEVLGDEKATTAVGFLRRAIAFYDRHGITVERVLTDNGSSYVSTVHAIACRATGIRPAHKALPPANQRQGLCLSFGVPSGWAARLPAPVGLTQAKGMSREGSLRTALAASWLPLACVRFVGRRVAGGPAKLT